MSDWLKGWLASEETAHDKIEVKRIYIDLNEGNLYDGVIFSQIMYWHGTSRETGKPRMTIEKEGYLWLAKGYGDWFVECRIGEATARQCISRIEKRGLIVKKLWKFNNTPTVHIRIDWDSLEEQLKWICYDISNGFDTTYQIGSDTSYQMNSTSDSKSLTDTTPSTTTETKSRGSRKASTAKGKSEIDLKTDAIIKAWLDGQTTQPVTNQYGNKGVRANAKAMAGKFTPEQITLYVKRLAKESYWSGKMVSIGYVANNIAAHYAAQPLTVVPESPLALLPKPIESTDDRISDEQVEEMKRITAALLEKTNANTKPTDPYGGWKPNKEAV